MVQFKSLSLFVIVVFIIFGCLSGCSFYHSEFDGMGSFVDAPNGGDFKEKVIPRGKALLYVYRPKTQWSMDEAEAPSFYMNDERIFGIKGGAYTYYYLKSGNYDIVLRRPLMGLEGMGSLNWHKMSEFSLKVQKGQTYYFRYSELDKVKLDAKSGVLPEGDGPIKRVSRRVALIEMKKTQLLHRNGETIDPKPPEKKKAPEEEESSSWWPF